MSNFAISIWNFQFKIRNENYKVMRNAMEMQNKNRSYSLEFNLIMTCIFFLLDYINLNGRKKNAVVLKMVSFKKNKWQSFESTTL